MATRTPALIIMIERIEDDVYVLRYLEGIRKREPRVCIMRASVAEVESSVAYAIEQTPDSTVIVEYPEGWKGSN